MKKKILEQFITKYNLGGLVEAVKWRADSDGLHTDFAGAGNGVMGFLSTPLLHLADGQDFNIADTVPLRRMLAVLSDEISAKIIFANEKPHSLILDDGRTKGTLVLSNAGLVPVPKKVQGIQDDLSIPIDSKFVTTYIKSCTAVSDTDTVTFVANDEGAQAILGYDEELVGSNIAIRVDMEMPVILSPITFPSKPLREVLSANSELTGGKIQIDKRGVACVTVIVPDFTATYYLTRKNS